MAAQNPNKTAKSKVRAYEWDDGKIFIASNLSTHFRGWDDTTAAMVCVTDDDIFSDEIETW